MSPAAAAYAVMADNVKVQASKWSSPLEYNTKNNHMEEVNPDQVFDSAFPNPPDVQKEKDESLTEQEILILFSQGAFSSL